MSADTEQQRLHDQARSELVAQQLANSKAYDTAVLSLSGAFLALSLAFTKDVLHGMKPIYEWILLTSWGLFSATIVATIASFLVSAWTIRRLIAGLDSYYLKGDRAAFDYSRRASSRLDIINALPGVLFVLAVVAIVLFVSLNFSRAINVETETKVVPPGYEERGQPVNAYRPVPQQPAQVPASDTRVPSAADDTQTSPTPAPTEK